LTSGTSVRGIAGTSPTLPTEVSWWDDWRGVSCRSVVTTAPVLWRVGDGERRRSATIDADSSGLRASNLGRQRPFGRETAKGFRRSHSRPDHLVRALPIAGRVGIDVNR
jgi:hypothetical protein